MPEQFALTKPAEMALQLTFTSGRFLRAAVVNGPGDQLLPGPRLSINEHAGVRGGDLVDSLQ
jgi:hypothetical protein